MCVCVCVCECVCVCACIRMLVLHRFIFHSSEVSEKDLCSECISKWNNIIIVSCKTSASFCIYNSTGGRSINNGLGMDIVKRGTNKWKLVEIQLKLVYLTKTASFNWKWEKWHPTFWCCIQHSDAKLAQGLAALKI